MRKKFDVVTVTLNPAMDQTVTIPNFTAGAVNRVSEVQSNPGGKGVNVAAVLADYGHSVAATGFLGAENSAPFETLFEKKKIKDCFVRIEGQTRVGIKITDPELKETTDINFPGHAVTPLNVDSLYSELQALDAQWYVLAGSLPPGVEKTIYRDLIALFRSRGAQVALDASDVALRHGIEAKPTLIKPNIFELETLTGKKLEGETAVIAAAKSLLRKGIEEVVVSMGAKGACFISNDETLVAVPPQVEVRSTVGAGDAMVAGLVAASLARLPLTEGAKLATSFSLHALSRLGAGLSSPASVLASMSRVTIRQPIQT
jgi:1-phosphofructokinase